MRWLPLQTPLHIIRSFWCCCMYEAAFCMSNLNLVQHKANWPSSSSVCVWLPTLLHIPLSRRPLQSSNITARCGAAPMASRTFLKALQMLQTTQTFQSEYFAYTMSQVNLLRAASGCGLHAGSTSSSGLSSSRVQALLGASRHSALGYSPLQRRPSRPARRPLGPRHPGTEAHTSKRTRKAFFLNRANRECTYQRAKNIKEHQRTQKKAT